MLRRFILNASVGGVGTQGEVVEGDDDLWSPLIEAGFLSPLADDDEREYVALFGAGVVTEEELRTDVGLGEGHGPDEALDAEGLAIAEG